MSYRPTSVCIACMLHLCRAVNDGGVLRPRSTTPTPTSWRGVAHVGVVVGVGIVECGHYGALTRCAGMGWDALVTQLYFSGGVHTLSYQRSHPIPSQRNKCKLYLFLVAIKLD